MLDPPTRVSPEDILACLIVAEDEKGEGKRREPPVELERVHPETLVHARSVAEEGGKECLENQAEVEHGILHTLLEDRILSRLTDDEISPLNNHNRDKEGGVAGVFKDFTVVVRPFLAVGINQVIDSRGVPRPPDTKQVAGPEPIFS